MKKEFFIVPLVIILSVGAGTASGFLLKKKFAPAEVDYSGLNINSYYDDTDALMDRYNLSSKESLDSVFTPYEMVNIAQEKYKNEQYTYSYGIGLGDASIVKQTIRSYQIRNNDKYFEESLSLSTFVNVAKRMYQNNGEVEEYNGKAESSETGKFNENEFNKFSQEEYIERMGKSLDLVFIYVISSKTVNSSSVKVNDEGNFEVDLSLDKDISVYHYVRQMKTISSLKNYPTFEYVNLKYVLDKDLNIVKLFTDERYHATTQSGIGSDVNSTIEYTYFIGKELKIPSLNESLLYGD